MSKTEKILLLITLVFLIGFCFLLPKPEGHEIVVEESYLAPEAAEALRAEEPEDGLWVILETRLDLNSATAEELTALPGIGKVLSGRIVSYREEHGPFTSPEELLLIEGMKISTVRGLFPGFEG